MLPMMNGKASPQKLKIIRMTAKVDVETQQGVFVAQSTETIYLVIKCGGEDLLDGVSVDNVEMRATN